MWNNFQKALHIKQELKLKKLNNLAKVIQPVVKHMV